MCALATTGTGEEFRMAQSWYEPTSTRIQNRRSKQDIPPSGFCESGSHRYANADRPYAAPTWISCVSWKRTSGKLTSISRIGILLLQKIPDTEGKPRRESDTETQCVNTAWKVRSWVLSAMSQTEEKNPNPLSQNRYSSPSIREKMGKRAKEGTEGKEKREREGSRHTPPPHFQK